MRQRPVGPIDGVEAKSGTSPIFIQVRPRSGRILLETASRGRWWRGQPSRRCGKDSAPHGSPPSCLPARGPPSRGADSAGARACTARRDASTVAVLRRAVTVAAARAAPPPPPSGAVWFLGTPSSAGITQQVVQQGGEATVWLRGYTGGGPLQVQVATDPSSPAVGVNLPAVNQTVTISGGLSVRRRRPDSRLRDHPD